MFTKYVCLIKFMKQNYKKVGDPTQKTLSALSPLSPSQLENFCMYTFLPYTLYILISNF